jgi:hypothetical protein
MLPVLIVAGSAAALGVFAGVLDRGRLATAGSVLASMLLLSVVFPAFRSIIALGIAAAVAFLVPNSWPLWARVLGVIGLMLVALLFTISPTYVGRVLGV